jgi:hypothetical protein
MPLRCYCPAIEPLILISRLPLIAHTNSLRAYSRMSVRQEMFSILKTESYRCLSSKRSGIRVSTYFVLLLIYIMALFVLSNLYHGDSETAFAIPQSLASNGSDLILRPSHSAT